MTEFEVVRPELPGSGVRYTPEAAASLVGQALTINLESGQKASGIVKAARYDVDGLHVTVEAIYHGPELDVVLLSGKFPIHADYSLGRELAEPPPLPRPVKPKGPDWSSVDVVPSPTRLEQILRSSRDATRE